MTIFWLIAAAGLALYGRFGAQKIKAGGVGEVVFGFCQLGMLVCFGLAFFSLSDPASHPVYGDGSGYADSTSLKVIFGFIGAGVVVWTLMGLVSRTSRNKAASGSEFRSSVVSLVIDQAAGVVRLTRPDAVVASTVPVGRLRIDVVDTGHGPADLAKVTVTRCADPFVGGIRLSPDSIAKGSAVVFEQHIPPAIARALLRWFKAHPELAPAATEAIEWQEAVDGLMRYVRQQRKGGKAPALEFWNVGNGPWLDYLVIEDDGSVFVAVGEHPVLVNHEAPIHADLTVLGTTVGGHLWRFPLDKERVAVLQQLQARGVLAVVHRPPGS